MISIHNRLEVFLWYINFPVKRLTRLVMSTNKIQMSIFFLFKNSSTLFLLNELFFHHFLKKESYSINEQVKHPSNFYACYIKF